MQEAGKVGDYSELRALFPTPEDVKQGDVTIAIPVLDFGQISTILGAFGPKLAALPKDAFIGDLIAENMPLAGELLAVAINKPLDYVHAMPADLIVRCINTLYRVNVDFFKTRIVPLLPGHLALWGNLMRRAPGQTS